MIDIQDQAYCPTLEEMGAYIKNSLFSRFCAELSERYQTEGQLEFSKCSWEHGWNVKFKKAGKSLCTIYPRENYFTVLVVIGKKEKDLVEAILPECEPEIQNVYHQTQEGNGQRWLMIDLEDEDSVYENVLKLIEIRRTAK